MNYTTLFETWRYKKTEKGKKWSSRCQRSIKLTQVCSSSCMSIEVNRKLHRGVRRIEVTAKADFLQRTKKLIKVLRALPWEHRRCRRLSPVPRRYTFPNTISHLTVWTDHWSKQNSGDVVHCKSMDLIYRLQEDRNNQLPKLSAP